MATGTQADFLARIKATLPVGWFANGTTTTLNALLGGLASAWASLYALYAYVRLQSRIATATGVFLDAIAVDFFGLTLTRQINESDAAFSLRIRAALFGPKVTRSAVIAALVTLTGRTPAVFEPANPMDAGGWGTIGMTAGTGFGYGVAGGWGSLALPFQFFLTAYRPISGGVANVAGYYTGSGWAGGGYGVGAIEYANLAMSTAVSDAQIQNAVNTTRTAASTAWMKIIS